MDKDKEIDMLRKENKYLKEKLSVLRSRCFEGAEKYFDKDMYTFLKIVSVRHKEP